MPVNTDLKGNRTPEVDEEFDGRFLWRQGRWKENLAELQAIANWGGSDSIDDLPKLWGFNHADPLYALQFSIMTLWLEASECYILGQFQACILTCGAVVERALKYEYQKLNGVETKNKKTLGQWIRELDGKLDSDVINWAEEILKPRNSRAHALLEQSDPFTAYMGSKRGLQQIGSNAYVLEYYRGDAKEVIERTFKILHQLYGKI